LDKLNVSVDPSQAERMTYRKQYRYTFEIGSLLTEGTFGEVVRALHTIEGNQRNDVVVG
jgi:NADPH-dependent curcumin reductase CurA